jgi:hypothetical protein
VSNKLQSALFGQKHMKKNQKNCFFFEFLGYFSIFETEAQLGALKILKSRRTKVVSNKYPYSASFQAQSNFAYFHFNSPYTLANSSAEDELRIKIHPWWVN